LLFQDLFSLAGIEDRQHGAVLSDLLQFAGNMRDVGQPILAADPLSSGSSRLKAGLQA
jgi:hypothetical protein